MSPRSHYDYSLWPEHARPRRKRFSAKAIGATLAILTVCGFAGSVVYSEFTRPQDPQALVGRSWPLQAADETPAQAQAQGQAPAAASAEAAAAPVSEPEPAKQVRSRVPVNAANRKVMPTIGTARLSGAETDGRGSGTKAVTEEATTPAAPVATAETTASTGKEIETPAESKPPVTAEKEKRSKKKKYTRRRQERDQDRGDHSTAVVQTQVYDYPDGRRVTVYRRLDAAPGYNAYSAPGGYPGYGGWRPAYAERPTGYRPY